MTEKEYDDMRSELLRDASRSILELRDFSDCYDDNDHHIQGFIDNLIQDKVNEALRQAADAIHDIHAPDTWAKVLAEKQRNQDCHMYNRITKGSL